MSSFVVPWLSIAAGQELVASFANRTTRVTVVLKDRYPQLSLFVCVCVCVCVCVRARARVCVCVSE